MVSYQRQIFQVSDLSACSEVMFLAWLLRVTGNQGPIPEREPEKWLPHPRKAAGAQITHSRHGEVSSLKTSVDVKTR